MYALSYLLRIVNFVNSIQWYSIERNNKQVTNKISNRNRD